PHMSACYRLIACACTRVWPASEGRMASATDTIKDLDRQSLRGFLAQVARELPDEILRVREPVSTRLDITSLVYELERMGKNPLVMFDRVEGHTMPVVTNVAGSRRLLALALGVTPAELPTAFRERCTRYLPVERVNRPEWEDITIEGDDIDLAKLPIPLHF